MKEIDIKLETVEVKGDKTEEIVKEIIGYENNIR